MTSAEPAAPVQNGGPAPMVAGKPGQPQQQMQQQAPGAPMPNQQGQQPPQSGVATMQATAVGDTPTGAPGGRKVGF